MKKRILSAFLCLCMMLTMVPAAFAVGDNELETNTNSSGGEGSNQITENTTTLQSGTYTLDRDVTLSGQLTVPENTVVTLDLNSHTLTESSTIIVEGDLTVQDSTATVEPQVSDDYKSVTYQAGSIVNKHSIREAKSVVITVQEGGSLTHKSGILKSEKNYTVAVYGNCMPGNNSPVQSKASIEGGYQIGQEGGPGVFGNGAQLDVSGGVIVGLDNSPVSGNGTVTNTNDYSGTVINLTGGTLIGHIVTNGYIACGVYHPQSGELNISDDVVIYADGGVGVLMRAGNANITGGTIIATGTASGGVGDKDINVPSSGVVYDVAHTPYPGLQDSHHVTISGNANVSSDSTVDALKIMQNENGNVRADGRLVVTGGTFSSDVSKFCDAAYTCTESNGKWVVSPAAGLETNKSENDDTVSVTVNGAVPSGNQDVGSDDGLDSSTMTEAIIDATTTPGGGTEKGATVTIPASTAATMESDSGYELTVKADVATVTLNNEAMKAVQSAAETDKDITIEIKKQTATADSSNIYSVTVKADGEDILSAGNAPADTEITITVPAPANASNVYVWLMHHDGTAWKKVSQVGGALTPDNEKKVTFITPHLSDYALYTTEQEGDYEATYTDSDGNAQPTTLQDAITNVKSGGTVTLLKDVTVENTIILNDNKALTIDLGGHTLSNSKGCVLNVYDDLTLRNGTVTIGDEATNTCVIWMLQEGKLKVEDDVIVTSPDGNWCIGLWSDCTESEVTVEGSLIGSHGLTVNGNSTSENNKVVIADGANIDVDGLALYLAGVATTEINNATVKGGITGVEIRAGSLTVNEGAQIAGGMGVPSASPNAGGTTSENIGIAIIQHTTKKPIDVQINGGTISGGAAVYESNPQENTGTDSNKVETTISGGTLNGDVISTGFGSTSISDGAVNGDVSAEGSGEITISGGTVTGNVSAKGTGTIAISGGTVTGSVTNEGAGKVSVTGGNFTTADVDDFINKDTQIIITLDANGGSCDVKAIVVSKDGAVDQLPTPTHRGSYSFRGWYTAPSGGKEVVETTTFSENTTLYAQWRYTGGSSSGGSSSGGGSTSSNRYTVSVPSDIDNGSISVSPSRAERGDTVTITVKPDEGYELHSLIALDSDGDRITIEKERENLYTFEMPSDRVTIEATFAEIEEQPTSLPFNDVSTSDWFYDEVMYAYENGIMNGMGNNQFQPNATTNRAMVVTILYRLAGSPDLSNENLGYPFADVDASSWYGDAVYWARLNGITNGISNTNFGPDGSITREQMAALLYRYADFAGYDVSTGGMSLSEYADASEISSYAVTAMQWANENGLITGRSATTLAPKGTATRAEVATILMRFCEDVVS